MFVANPDRTAVLEVVDDTVDCDFDTLRSKEKSFAAGLKNVHCGFFVSKDVVVILQSLFNNLRIP